MTSWKLSALMIPIAIWMSLVVANIAYNGIDAPIAVVSFDLIHTSFTCCKLHLFNIFGTSIGLPQIFNVPITIGYTLTLNIVGFTAILVGLLVTIVAMLIIANVLLSGATITVHVLTNNAITQMIFSGSILFILWAFFLLVTNSEFGMLPNSLGVIGQFVLSALYFIGAVLVMTNTVE